jgi:hypothetical protein
MISPSALKDILGAPNPPKTTDSFIQIHRHLEGYFKRVLFIGLRLNGAQYSTGQLIINSVHMDVTSQIKKAITLIDRRSDCYSIIIDALEAEYRSLFKLFELFQNFSAKYRNRIAHGIISEIRDPAILESLIRVDQLLFKEFETMLMAEHGHSALQMPKDWGARRGTKESADSLIKRLKLGKISLQPIAIKDVHRVLTEIGDGIQ